MTTGRINQVATLETRNTSTQHKQCTLSRDPSLKLEPHFTMRHYAPQVKQTSIAEDCSKRANATHAKARRFLESHIALHTDARFTLLSWYTHTQEQYMILPKDGHTSSTSGDHHVSHQTSEAPHAPHQRRKAGATPGRSHQMCYRLAIHNVKQHKHHTSCPHLPVHMCTQARGRACCWTHAEQMFSMSTTAPGFLRPQCSDNTNTTAHRKSRRKSHNEDNKAFRATLAPALKQTNPQRLI
mmetsp:Transcript_22090/g.39152  ORF Transcript_22090/g.39152 Transcript_22090/m.39152 type:complete len:240 (-) Transcript_22090:132-851(-)